MIKRTIRFEDEVFIDEGVDLLEGRSIILGLARKVRHERKDYPLSCSSVRFTVPTEIVYSLHVRQSGENSLFMETCLNNSLDWVTNDGVKKSLEFVDYILNLNDEEKTLVEESLKSLINRVKDFESGLTD